MLGTWIKCWIGLVAACTLVSFSRLGACQDRKEPYATAAAAERSEDSVPGTENEEAPDQAEEDDPEAEAASTPSAWRAAPVAPKEYAAFCAQFDVVAHPEQVIDILEYASDTTGTPVDVLFSVWQKETGYLDGDGLSGGCNLMHELTEYRDKYAGTRHAEAMLAMAEAFDWKERYGQNLERMKCSCPSKDKETGERKGYGGCCGPFQFSGAEVDDEYAIPLKLDPMRFCGGALIAGWELKKHHDNAFKPRYSRKLKKWLPGRGTLIQQRIGYANRDHAAWHAAMSRYYGGDHDGKYGNTAVHKWKTFQEWRIQDAKEPGFLVRQILGLGNTKRSLRKLRADRTTVAYN